MMIKANMRTAAFSQASAQRSVVCKAADQHVAARRSVMLGFGSILPAMISMPALALILDEDDEDLVEKAKANRKNRLAQDKSITRNFLEAEGLKDKKLNLELVPIQVAVFKLAKSGSQLDSGDVKAASSTLSEAWVKDFTNAAKQLGDSNDVLSKLDQVKGSAGKGDLSATKKSYVELVAELQSWTAGAGISSKLTGL